MGRSFVTTAVEEPITIGIVCQEPLVVGVLFGLLDAVGMRGVVLDPSAETTRGELYAILWVDMGDRSKTESTIRFLYALSVPVWYVCFDAMPEEGAGGHTFARSASSLVQSTLKNKVVLQYLDVLFPGKTSYSWLGRELEQTLAKRTIDATGEVYPLWYEDCLNHVVTKLMHAEDATGVYAGQEGIAFEELMARVAGRLHVSLSSANPVAIPIVRATPIPGRGVDDMLSRLVFTVTPLIEPSIPEKKQKKKKAKRLGKLVKILFVCVFIFGATVVGTLKWQQQRLQQELSLILSSLPSTSTSQLRDAISTVTTLQQLEKGSDQVQELSTLQTALKAGSDLATAREVFLQMASNAVSGQGRENDKLAAKAGSSLEEAYRLLGDLPNGLQYLDESTANRFTALLPELKKEVLTLRTLTQIVPDLLAMNGQKTYAVILADTTNARSAGGSIEAVTLLTFDHGSLQKTQTFGVSALDKLLTGTVAPPDEIKTYLHSYAWSLDDATWDPSFTQVTARVSWFLGKQLNRQIDGVVVIPSSRLTALLANPGIDSQLHDTITNLPNQPSGLEQFYTQALTTLISRVTEKPTTQTLETFFGVAGDALSSQDLAIHIADPGIQSSISLLGWDGEVTIPNCPNLFADGPCAMERSYVLDTNLGNTNGSLLIRRSHLHSITVTADHLEHDRRVTLHNLATQDAWPYGAYQSLLRFVLPSNATITAVAINNSTLPSDQWSQITLQDSTQVLVKTTVPIGGTSVVDVSYQTPSVIQAKGSLVIFEQHQIGTTQDPLAVSIQYPNSMNPSAISPKAAVSGNTLSFQETLDQNRLFAVHF